MKTLTPVIIFFLLFANCQATEQFPPTSTKTHTSYDDEVERVVQIEPDEITGAQIMMYFIPKAMSFRNGQSQHVGKALRKRIFDNLGLDSESRQAVVELMKTMLIEFKQLGDSREQCWYISKHHDSVTAEQVAQMKNQYGNDADALFEGVYNDLDIVLSNEDAVNLRRYLRKLYLARISYPATTRIFTADDKEVQNLIKRCLPKGRITS